MSTTSISNCGSSSTTWPQQVIISRKNHQLIDSPSHRLWCGLSKLYSPFTNWSPVILQIDIYCRRGFPWKYQYYVTPGYIIRKSYCKIYFLYLFYHWALVTMKYISYLPLNRRYHMGHGRAVTHDDISDFTVNNYYISSEFLISHLKNISKNIQNFCFWFVMLFFNQS